MQGHHVSWEARGAGCEKDVGEILIYYRDGMVIAGLLPKIIGKGERGQKQRSLRRLIDEVDCIHRVLVMRRTAQLLIKLMTRDQRAKAALTTNFPEPRTGGIGIYRHTARHGAHDSKDGGDRGGRFVQINNEPISTHTPFAVKLCATWALTDPVDRSSAPRSRVALLVLRLTRGSFCQ